MLMPFLSGNPGLYGGGAFTWTPADFSSVTLVGYYDAEDNTKITDVGGACSAWVDSANGANIVAQGTAASRPTIVTNATTERQVLQFDGTDDSLVLAPCPYTTAAGNLSIMVVGIQDALPANTTTRYSVTTGASTTNGLMLPRTVVSGNNRFSTITGNGAGGSNASGSAPGFMDGRFIGIGSWATTLQSAQLNGATAASANNAVMTGDTTRFRIGASAAVSPSGFWNGAISAILYVTGTLSATDNSNFTRWAAIRLGWSA